MSITTYAELQTAIADWLARPGDATITAIAPDLIRLCEDRLNYGFERTGHEFYSAPLRTSAMLTRSTSTPTGEFIATPTDFLDATVLKWNASPEKNLKYRTPSMFVDAAASFTSGEPDVYTIIGQNFRLGPAPGSDNTTTLELSYYAKIPALTALNTTNWLLTKAPSIYLYGSLVHAAPYIGDTASLALWMAQFLGGVNAIEAQDKRMKWGNEAPATSVANGWVY